MTFSHGLSTNNYGPAKFIVDASVANGTHTTIASALTSASSGDTIFIRPGTYTENLTLKAGVNLAAYGCDQDMNHVIISGKCTFTAAGTVSITGIRLQTNSDFFLAVTGNANSIVGFNNCYLNCLNNTGISYTSSGVSSGVYMVYCFGDIATTGISLFTSTGSGSLILNSCDIENSGLSTTNSTSSSGVISYINSRIVFPTTITSTGVIQINHSIISVTAATNNTVLTYGGSSSNSFAIHSSFSGGTSSAISIGSTFTLSLCSISSSNTNAITGAGTLNYSGLTFTGTSSNINTTTQIGGTLQGGQTQNPSAGFIGESISNSAAAVATSNATPKTIASITLTPGIWDISVIAGAAATGGTAIMTAMQGSISTTNNTMMGTLGIDQFQIGTLITSSNQLTCSIPQYRVVVTSNTVYYLVVANFYSSTTCPTGGRISATRVG